MVQTSILLDNVHLQLLSKVLQLFHLIPNFLLSPTIQLDSSMSLIFVIILILSLSKYTTCLDAAMNLVITCSIHKICIVKRLLEDEVHDLIWTKKSYLEEIMDCGMLEFLDGHIVAYGDVLISHHLLETIPS